VYIVLLARKSRISGAKDGTSAYGLYNLRNIIPLMPKLATLHCPVSAPSSYQLLKMFEERKRRIFLPKK
jgi:hypothetical protein